MYAKKIPRGEIPEAFRDGYVKEPRSLEETKGILTNYLLALAKDQMPEPLREQGRSAKDILDHCCEAWTKLVDQPWTSWPSACVIGHTRSEQLYLVSHASTKDNSSPAT